jgi:hypothetical protein
MSEAGTTRLESGAGCQRPDHPVNLTLIEFRAADRPPSPRTDAGPDLLRVGQNRPAAAGLSNVVIRMTLGSDSRAM